jgi:long-chain acyl-CoA synthetase
MSQLGALSLAEVFDARAEAAGDRTAVVEASGRWTYGDLLQRSRAISNRLAPECEGPGRRVALMLPNSGALVASFYAVARVGGVIAPFNVRYREQEIRYYLNDTGAAALLVTPEAVERARAAVAALEHPPALFEVNAAGAGRLVEAGSARVPAPPAAPGGADAPLLQQYTSGSTGAPKRIVRTHRHLLRELDSLAEVFALSADDRFLGAAPFSHVNGMVRTMLTSMHVGGVLYPVAEFKRRETIELIRRERITYFGAVPYMFVLLADTPGVTSADGASLRIVFSASAPLRPEDNLRFAGRWGRPIRQLYGSTETGTISVNMHPRLEERLESVGRPLPGVVVRVVDDEGRPRPPGVEGEVAIASPTAITAYEGNPEANAAGFRDGFYRSGDLGRMDADGYLTLAGRTKFLINRGGYKVNPLEVEQAVRSHPKVQEVVVLGMPTPFGDEAVRCVIVSRDPCTEEEILQHCRPLIADFKIPSRIEFRTELPKSETGKILRHQL